MNSIRVYHVAAAVSLLLLVASASAQAPSGSGPLPYSTSIGSDIEQIDLATGTLNLNVPFVRVPGKHMRFDFGLSYNPGFWSQVENPDQTMRWVLPPANRLLIKGTNLVGWRATQGFVTWADSPAYCVENDGQEANIGQNASIFYTSGGTQGNDYSLTDRHGIGHNFLVNYFNSGECDREIKAGQFNSSNFEGPSPDMDGFYATLGPGGSSINIYGPDGTQYTGVASTQTVASGGYSNQGSMFSDRVAELDPAGNTQAVAPGFADSLGRSPITEVVNGNQIIYTVHDSNGMPQVYTVIFVNQALTSPDNSGIAFAGNQANSGVDQLITSIQPPQGSPYQFQYDASGALTQLTLPSGAVIRYTWQVMAGEPIGSKIITQRSVSHDGVTDVWDIDRSHPQAGITVLNPADSTGQRYMSVYNFDQDSHLIRVQYLMGSTQQSSLTLQYDIAWDTQRAPADGSMSSNALMTSLTTTLENGMVSKKTFDYDLYSYPYQLLNCGDKQSGFFECLNLSNGSTSINNVPFVPTDITYLPPATPFPGSHGNVTGVHEYNWGNGAPGPLVRQTIRKYLHDQNPNYFSYGAAVPGVRGRLIRNIVNRVADEAIYDGSAFCTGAATWVGDGSGNITPAPDCTAKRVSETITTYDNGNPDTYGYKGLPTSVQKWAGGTTYLVSSTTYDASGNPLIVVDPLGYTTTYGYADAFSSAGSCGIPAGSGGYVTSVTNAALEQTAQVYNACTGTIASSTDANGLTTSVAYDWNGRVISNTNADGGITTTAYDEMARTITTDQHMNSSQVREIITQMDMLGHAIQTRLTTDPAGALIANTTYDAFGRAVSTTNSFHSTTEATYGVATQTYDARGRKSTQTNPDGTTATLSYAGNVTTLTDENGHTHSQTTDVFGRLINVAEPGGRSTDYSYDLLGNLTYVNQHGLSTEAPRTRSFSYDTLSRLLQSNNPETGTISYAYDANGNLLYKTDARGITIGYRYDALNRMISKTGPGINDTYRYDAEPAGSSITTSNAIGHLVWMSNNVNADLHLAYDSMGRTIHQQGCIPTNCVATATSVSASYDLVGNMTDLTYPDGHHIHQTFDGAGRLSTSSLVDIAGVPSTTSYLQSEIYFPDGSPMVMTLGNGVQETMTKNNRLQISNESVSTPLSPFNNQVFLSKSYCYVNCTTGGTANNGNIWGITDNLNAANSQGFTYDALNRFTGFALGGVPNQQYAIDSFGNMSPMANGSPINQFDPATNRISNLPCASAVQAFDNAGNQTCSSDQYGGVTQNVYDAESRIASMNTLNTVTPYVSYVYGADGGRVEKSKADGTYTEYIDFNGQPIAELDQTGAWTDYIYANGTKIAKVAPESRVMHLSETCGECDWWGTANYVVPSMASALSGYTFQPGDQLAFEQRQVNTVGGIFGYASDGTSPSLYDQQGNLIWSDPDTSGLWHSRVVAMDAWVGKTAGPFIGLDLADSLPVGVSWDIWIADVVLVKANGTTVPVYTGQQTSGEAVVPSLGSHFETTFVNDPLPGTRFFTGDHLGTSQMELSSGGWPVWQGQFDPFGQELDQQFTAMHYKFTGKERDTESGLDYFGARYYGSSMGRFMSPDWDSDPFPVPYASLEDPQSLNLYAYVRNNPLSSRDPDGHASYQDCNGGTQQCWQGDYNGERDCSGSAGCLFWNQGANSGAGEWQGSDPNPPPGDPAGDAFTGLTRMMLSSSWGDFSYGLKTMGGGYAKGLINGPSVAGVAMAAVLPILPTRAKLPNLTGKSGAKDIPSWAAGSGPQGSENGKQYASRMMDAKYGSGNWATSSQEFSQLKKYGDRSFAPAERTPSEPTEPSGPKGPIE